MRQGMFRNLLRQQQHPLITCNISSSVPSHHENYNYEPSITEDIGVMSHSAIMTLSITQPHSTCFIHAHFNGAHKLSNASTVYCRSSMIRKPRKWFDTRSAPAGTQIRYFDYLLQCVGFALACPFCLAKPQSFLSPRISFMYLCYETRVSVWMFYVRAQSRGRTFIQICFIINSLCTI